MYFKKCLLYILEEFFLDFLNASYLSTKDGESREKNFKSNTHENNLK